MLHNLIESEGSRQIFPPTTNMSTIRILKTHVNAIEKELDRRFPRVEKVGPLVVKALDIVKSGKPSELELESTGMLEQLVHAANICRNRRRVDQEQWDDISEQLKDFLDGIQKKFEKFHPDWDDGDVYIEWTALKEPFYCSDVDDESDCGDSTQDMDHEVAFAYDRNSEHEYRRRVVDEYELLVTWLGETNRGNVYQEFREHMLRLREEDQYAHTPVHLPGVLRTERS